LLRSARICHSACVQPQEYLDKRFRPWFEWPKLQQTFPRVYRVRCRSAFQTQRGNPYEQWQGHNALIVGPTGVGKTFLACALGNAACRQGLSVRYYRVPTLLREAAVAQGDGQYFELLKTLRKAELLILDDWGLANLLPAESRDLLEVLEDRSQRFSTLVASQLPIEHWHQSLGDSTIADAILDRIIHNAHKVLLRGESMRKITRNSENEAEFHSKKED
jgi:DNA replication protein DnaC